MALAAGLAEARGRGLTKDPGRSPRARANRNGLRLGALAERLGSLPPRFGQRHRVERRAWSRRNRPRATAPAARDHSEWQPARRQKPLLGPTFGSGRRALDRRAGRVPARPGPRVRRCERGPHSVARIVCLAAFSALSSTTILRAPVAAPSSMPPLATAGCAGRLSPMTSRRRASRRQLAGPPSSRRAKSGEPMIETDIPG